MDTWLFHLFNTTLTAPFLDTVASVVATKWLLAGVAVLLGALSFVLGGRELRWSLVLGALVFIVSDLTVLVLKDIIARTRPCQALDGARVLAGCSESYSFPSRHATDMFAVMVLFGARHPGYSPAFLAAALVIAWSRVYAGAHYPLDVLAGAILGSALAASVVILDKRFGDIFVERFRGYVRRDNVF
jgi:undecaprenyl-diphosphatase